MTLAVDERRAYRRSGVPVPKDPNESWTTRLLKNKLFWLTVVLLAVYAACLVLLYLDVVPDKEVPGGTAIGLGTEAVPIAAKYAAITVIPLSLAFLWADRFRPQRFWVWLMTFGWGSTVATFLAYHLNSYLAQFLSVAGDGDPATASRAAIFLAPFTEEATKGTVLFWLAILMRYQWVSRLSGIVLAGLSGAAFAFTENIIYYGRVYRYAAQTYGQVKPDEALQDLFLQRGVMTFFGHPLFTAMLGVGLAIALRSKSKVVRVVAPLAGFLAAAFLHMAFNTTASLVQGTQLLMMWGVGVALTVGLIVFMVRQLFREGKLIRARLTDYVRVGWLDEGDPIAFGRLRTRLKALWHGLFQGFGELLDTFRIQRAVTELAYLRDAITRGLVDDIGLKREKDLIFTIRSLRDRAVISPVGKADYPSLPRFKRGGTQQQPAVEQWAPPSYPGPAGLGGSYPAQDPMGQGAPPQIASQPGPPNTPGPGSAPLGSGATQYSEVDPKWGPPGS
ncbi:MAG: PrsW family intramembrane metalloprotease [Propionibacteriaceae bacterium]